MICSKTTKRTRKARTISKGTQSIRKIPEFNRQDSAKAPFKSSITVTNNQESTITTQKIKLQESTQIKAKSSRSKHWNQDTNWSPVSTTQKILKSTNPQAPSFKDPLIEIPSDTQTKFSNIQRATSSTMLAFPKAISSMIAIWSTSFQSAEETIFWISSLKKHEASELNDIIEFFFMYLIAFF